MFSLFKKNKIFYLDHAAGTPIDSEVLKSMTPYFTESFYNAGSIYTEGFFIRGKLADARKKIADCIMARPQEIIFTDGGTEANNLALRGLVSAWRRENKGLVPHIITCVIEHSSILETCRDLEKNNLAEVSYISVDEQGIVDIKELKKSIRENTILVSISYVNGEIGVVQNISAIAKIIRHHRKFQKTSLPYFHTDAVQALNYRDTNVQKLGVDMMTINGSKIYGPKKIAALYKKINIPMDAIITGGNQEFGLRAGTENTPAIIGFAESVSLTCSVRESEKSRLQELQIYTEKLLKEKMNVPFVINAEESERIPNIINISIPQLSSEEIVLRLDAVGIKASVKSACKSGEDGDSHVIRALRNENTQSIRFSCGRGTQEKDICYIIEKLVTITNSMKKTHDYYITKKKI